MLMMFLCWSHFPPKRSPGDPTFWTTEEYCRLLREVYEAKPIDPTRWESAACTNLSKKQKFKRKNKPASVGALRTALDQAKDPKSNYVLFRLIDQTERILKEDHERRGHVWPAIHLEDTLGRVQTIEQTLGDNNRLMEPSDVKSDAIEFDDKDEAGCFDLLNELRTRDHDDLLGELLAADAPFHHFLLKFLESRRTNDHDVLKEGLVGVNGYDGFLKVVENVIAADHRAALEAVMDNALESDRGDMSDAVVLASETFTQACIAHDRKREEAISRGLSEFYCEQLMVGKISLSQAMARAGLISRADLLG
jgi:hypothetical protein